MKITLDKAKQPIFKTAKEIERWCAFQQKHFVKIEMSPMEKRNLEQELKDVLEKGLESQKTEQDKFFYAQTRVTLYELYVAISGGKLL